MLCCVPKRLADGGPFYDEALFHDGILFHDETDNSPLSSIREIQIELFPEGEPAFFKHCFSGSHYFLNYIE